MKVQAINYSTPSFRKNEKYDLMKKNELIDFLQKGYTQKEIAEKFNIPQHVVTRAIKTYFLFPSKIKHAERRINTLNSAFKK